MDDEVSDEENPVGVASARVAEGAGKKTRADRNRQIRRRDAEMVLGAKRRLKTQRREIDQLAQHTAEIAEHAALLAVRQERREVRLVIISQLTLFLVACIDVIS